MSFLSFLIFRMFPLDRLTGKYQCLERHRPHFQEFLWWTYRVIKGECITQCEVASSASYFRMQRRHITANGDTDGAIFPIVAFNRGCKCRRKWQTKLSATRARVLTFRAHDSSCTPAALHGGNQAGHARKIRRDMWEERCPGNTCCKNKHLPHYFNTKTQQA